MWKWTIIVIAVLFFVLILTSCHRPLPLLR